MTLVEVVLAFAKIFVILNFLLPMAALATWADRRQSALVQDRVGPQRAVVMLPNLVARALVVAPPALLSVLTGLSAFGRLRGQGAHETLFLASQGAVLLGWLSLTVLTHVVSRHGVAFAFESALQGIRPRAMFYGGLAAHGVALVATLAAPSDLVPAAARAALLLLAAVLAATGVYSAARIPEGKIPLRLLGILHSVADPIKLIFKEDFIPLKGDKLLHALAPILAMFPALVTFAVIPFGDSLCFQDNGDGIFGFSDLTHLAPTVSRALDCRGHLVRLQIADLNIGILYLFAMAGTGVIGAAIAGWASDNKFSLLGGLRAASQMVSYEVAMGLSLVGLFIIYGSVRLGDMVEWQGNNAWGIFVQPVAFLLFLAALNVEMKRVPFDQPEGESEIVAGYFVEYSGMKFGMFFTGEYAELITSSALLVTLFFGGHHLPFLHRDGLFLNFGETTVLAYKMTHLATALLSVVVFFAKTIFVVWLQIFFRWTLPRFRYDQVMRLGWTKLLPFALGNILVTAVVVLAFDGASPSVQAGAKVIADVTQAIVAIGMLSVPVFIALGILAPTHRVRFLGSSATRFTKAAGTSRAATIGA